MEEAKEEAAQAGAAQAGTVHPDHDHHPLRSAQRAARHGRTAEGGHGPEPDNPDFCLTEEMSKQGFEEMFKELGKDGECKYQRFDVSGGKLDALLQCESKAEGKGTIALSGNVGSTRVRRTVKIDTVNPASPMGSTAITMQMVSKRTRCSPGGEMRSFTTSSP